MRPLAFIATLAVVCPSAAAGQTAAPTATTTVAAPPGTTPRITLGLPPPTGTEDRAAELAAKWGRAVEDASLDDTELRAAFLTLKMEEREAVLDVWPDVAPATPKAQRAYRDLIELQERWLRQQETSRRLAGLKARMLAEKELLRGDDTGPLVGSYFAALGGFIAFRVIYLLVLTGGGQGELTDASGIAAVAIDVLAAPAVTAGIGLFPLGTSDAYDYGFAPAYLGASLTNLVLLLVAVGLSGPSPGLAAITAVLDFLLVPAGAVLGTYIERKPLPIALPRGAPTEAEPESSLDAGSRLPSVRTVGFAWRF